jgi:uncharacterized DUF497 family protein
MRFGFEWDEAKAQANIEKHGISFDEAATVFTDWGAPVDPDPLHSDKEDRLMIIGASEHQRLLTVVFTFRDGDMIRIISARRATARERRTYEKENIRD